MSKKDQNNPDQPAATNVGRDESIQTEEREDLQNRLNRETGLLAWNELARFFARGIVIKVEPELDLVDVGRIVAADDTAQLQSWIDAALVARASDDDARRWTQLDPEPEFWCLVTAPWVLVQERDIARESPSGQTLH